MSKDYYDILGVSKSASQDEIKAAFRKKAHEHHPDKGGDAEKFKEYNEAYQILGNPEKRQKYDQFGSAAFQQGGAGGWGGQGFSGFQNGAGMDFDLEDLSEMFGGFGDIFGFGGSSRASHKRQTRGRDMEMELKLDFLEAVFGTEKEISFSRQEACKHCQGKGAEPGAKITSCEHCHGTGSIAKLQRTILGNIQTKVTCPYCQGDGQMCSQKCSVCSGSGINRVQAKLKVKIPAGIATGESIRLGGQGEAGQRGAVSGDLYLRVRVQAHKKFVRDGYDIRTEESISIKQAILGDKIEVETVDGTVKLKIPEGTQSGTIFKIKERGVPRLHNSGRGDHFIRINVKIPAGLNKKNRVLLQELDI